MEIVATLQPYIVDNSTETKYQQEIENCLKFLGWRNSNKTMQSQVTINIGNNNSIRPDIVLYKNGVPVLPIEIKRPNNTCNAKQQTQLKSYMRQLRLNIGLYIGENIQLYYDNPEDRDNPISVFKVELQQDDKNGEPLCEILFYPNFDIQKLEDLCKERYNQIVARNNLHQRLEEFFSENNAVKNLVILIKEKFIKEGYREDVLEDELCKLSLSIQWRKNMPLSNIIKASVASEKSEEEEIEHDRYFSFDGVNYHCKRKFVLELIKDYVAINSGMTFEELEKVFPSNLHSKALGVIRTLASVKERIVHQPDLQKRYFLKDSEIITLSNGTKVVVNNQWGKKFPNFLNKARNLYHITGRLNK